jgi:NDP-mannose synthase
MIAIILAGGKGTRLKPFTTTIPKPLLPLGDQPILEIVLRQLSFAGFERVIITLGHMAHLFNAVIGDGTRWNIHIDYCLEEEPLGTAGPLRLINNLDENFLVMNGDLLTTLDYRHLFDIHVSCAAWGTIAMRRREVHIDYGVIHADKNGLLHDYIEKPIIPYDVSMGINILNKRCIDYIPVTGRFDMPQLLMTMHRDGKNIVCHETDCYWQDIGRFDDYQQASEDFTKDPTRFMPDLKSK